MENTQQREFDKLFDSIPVYDGEDPEKFEPWLSKLESACLVGKRDVREVAICSSTGPVLEVLNSIVLNIGLELDTRNVEQTKDVRMYT